MDKLTRCNCLSTSKSLISVCYVPSTKRAAKEVSYYLYIIRLIWCTVITTTTELLTVTHWSHPNHVIQIAVPKNLKSRKWGQWHTLRIDCHSSSKEFHFVKAHSHCVSFSDCDCDLFLLIIGYIGLVDVVTVPVAVVLSPVWPICCNKKNHSCNQKKNRTVRTSPKLLQWVDNSS